MSFTRRALLRAALLALSLSALHVGGASAEAPSPKARTEALIAAFKQVKRAPEGGALSAADAKANEQAFTELDAYFDRARLVGDPISPFKDKFSPAQLERFQGAFWKTLRLITYTDSGAFFQKAKITFKPAVLKEVAGVKHADVPMNAYVEEDDAETDVIFHWASGPEGWRLVDTSFDDASLVKDYQNQFGRIIGKEGVDALIQKLEARYAKIRKQKGLAP